MTTLRSSAPRSLALLALATLAACGSSNGPPRGGGGGGGGGPFQLTVIRAGQGTVASSPQGIDCGGTCSFSFAAGTSVTLAAVAAGGYTFSEWSGAGIGCAGTGPCTVEMTEPRTVIARFLSSDTADLCNGLVTDKLAHPMTAVSKPAVGAAYIDPQFGTTIRRISDALATSTNVVKPVYSTIQAWNADESYLILYHTDGSGDGHYLYDGKTYARIKLLDIRPADLEQVYWDSADPRILYYTDIVTRRLHRFDVDTDTHATSAVVRDFSAAPVGCSDDLTGGSDPMWTSWDSRFFGYTCGRAAGARLFTYDRISNTIGTVAVMDAAGNAPQPAPSGTLFFLNVGGAAQVRDANLVLLRTLGVNGDEHATVGTSDGVDTHFSIQFDVAPHGTVIATNMATGAKRVIVGEATGYPYPPNGTHLSAVAYGRPGWLAASVVGAASGAGLLDQEILLVNANTGGTAPKVCRVAHHRSHGAGGPQGYWAEPHASISPSATRILFASDWGGGATVDTYVVELPSYRP